MLKRICAFLKKAPGSKAKDVAAHLKVERAEINKVLYGDKERFWQDGDFRWFLVSPSELHIEFAGAWLQARDFEKTLCRFSSPLASSCASVAFVLRDDCTMMLEVLARLLALCNQLVTAGKKVTLNFEESRKTLTYLDRLGFFDLLSASIVVLPRRPKGALAKTYRGNNDGVIELREIDPMAPDEEVPKLLEQSFVSCAGSSYSVAAFTILSELFRNVIEHSGVTAAGFAGLQFYKRGNHIQAVISDNGRGIVGTLEPVLQQRYPKIARKIAASTEPSGVALLREVFSFGGISQVDEDGRGLGLKASRDQASKFRAKISVRQSDFEFRIRHSPDGVTLTHHSDLVRLDGTHICFDFLLDATVRSR